MSSESTKTLKQEQKIKKTDKVKLRALHALIIVHLVHKVMYLPAKKSLKCKSAR